MRLRFHRLAQPFDILFCSDLINLAELRAFAGSALANIPIVLYFHENQFSYPVQPPNQVDRHLAFNNLSSAAAADEIWWNSSFNQREFLDSVKDYTQRFRDYDFSAYVEAVELKSLVFPPGIDLVSASPESKQSAYHLLGGALGERQSPSHILQGGKDPD
ncbi:MAG: DUF3524 domain-containing protein [Pirellulaceae bacterium]